MEEQEDEHGALTGVTSVGGFSIPTLVSSVVSWAVLGGGSAGGLLASARRADDRRYVTASEPAIRIEGE